MLQIEHLTKTYGEKKAVDDLSLHILPGEIYGFIGHNGAGKTTTLKSVAGILRFDAGEIRIAGTSIRTDPLACKRKLAYIPDNPDLYDYMTGIQYLNFIANIFGVSAAERQVRIRELAERFELTNDLAQPIVADKADAVFTPTDNTVMTAELAIYEALAKAGIPHYTGADSFALNGAFLGYGVDYANLGAETANMVSGILLDGSKPSATPVLTFDNGTATINTDICRELGLNYDELAETFAPLCTKVQSIVTAESFDDLNQ